MAAAQTFDDEEFVLDLDATEDDLPLHGRVELSIDSALNLHHPPGTIPTLAADMMVLHFSRISWHRLPVPRRRFGVVECQGIAGIEHDCLTDGEWALEQEWWTRSG